MAELVSIVFKPKDAVPAAGAFTRQSVPEARLVAGHGIEGDEKGGNVYRQLNVMGSESVQDLHAAGYLTKPGMLGEQLVISEPSIELLPAGTRIQIGSAAVIELLRLREPCDRFESYQGKAKEGAVAKIGWMASVISSGTIRLGDRVTVLSPEPALV